jgi:hypothetical protein
LKFNPNCEVFRGWKLIIAKNKLIGGPFSRPPCHMLCISLWMLGEGQQIRELKLGGVNHDGMRK